MLAQETGEIASGEEGLKQTDDLVNTTAHLSTPSVGELLSLKATTPALETELDNADPDEIPSPTKKRKRLKIVPGKTTGSKLIFDEEGAAANPLAALASDVAAG